MAFSNRNAVFWNVKPSSLMDMFRRYMLPPSSAQDNGNTNLKNP
jgi:hypothetical protein